MTPITPAKTKTIIITRNAFSWQFGGAEQFTYNLARELKSQGIRPVVATRVPELLEKCQQSGIQTFKNIWLQNRGRGWLAVYVLLSPLLIGQYVWLIFRYRAKLVFAGSRDDQIFGSVAGWLARTPSLWIDHADMKHLLKSGMSKRWYRWAMRFPKHIVAVSAFEQAVVSSALPRALSNKFMVIHNGATLQAAARASVPAKKTIISYVGRIEEDKGLYDLVQAAAGVVQLHPEVEFWLIGKGSIEDALAARIRSDRMEKHIKLLGHHDNVSAILQASRLFVYPTHHDAAPLAPVEALLAGVPVIATNVGGIPEVVTDECGILVDKSRPEQLADAINKVLDNPDYYARLQKGAVAAGAKFDFKRIAREHYLPLFNDAMGSK